MQKINPYLWYTDQAEEAANFYTSIFENSQVMGVTRYGEAGPGVAGTAMIVNFQLAGQDFIALNGGPQFSFTPAISFFVNCDTTEEVTALWDKLVTGGMVLMELGTYPFSEKFGWLQDKFGVSWQLNLGSETQKIVPVLMYVGDQHGRAQEAINFYVSLFADSAITHMAHYDADEGEAEGTVKRASFTLHGQQFGAMDSGRDHAFTFTPAISLLVNCQTQTEVDNLWEQLTAGGHEEPCGWLRDRFGVSWQIIPTLLGELINDPDPVKAQNVMQAMLQMKKIDSQVLQEAYDPSAS